MDYFTLIINFIAIKFGLIIFDFIKYLINCFFLLTLYYFLNFNFNFIINYYKINCEIDFMISFRN